MRVFLVMLSMALALSGQEREFEVESRLVLVPLSVTDAKGRAVDGLDAGDFHLFDNGRPQQVALDTFGTGLPPIALVVVVETSGISAVTLGKVREVGSMIQPLITGQRGVVGLLAVDEEIEWMQELTGDPYRIADSFYRLRPGAEMSARLLDAADGAIARLRQVPNFRRVLFLISESRDRGSEADLEAVAIAAQEADITVYAATYSAFKTSLLAKRSPPARLPERPPETPNLRPIIERTPLPPPSEQQVDLLGALGELIRLGKENTTHVLVEATGGATFSFTAKRGLEGAIEKLGSELHSQYMLSFTPDEPSPGYHRIEVQLGVSGEHTIRARPGYWSEP